MKFSSRKVHISHFSHSKKKKKIHLFAEWLNQIQDITSISILIYQLGVQKERENRHLKFYYCYIHSEPSWLQNLHLCFNLKENVLELKIELLW